MCQHIQSNPEHLPVGKLSEWICNREEVCALSTISLLFFLHSRMPFILTDQIFSGEGRACLLLRAPWFWCATWSDSKKKTFFFLPCHNTGFSIFSFFYLVVYRVRRGKAFLIYFDIISALICLYLLLYVRPRFFYWAGAGSCSTLPSYSLRDIIGRVPSLSFAVDY